MQSTCRVCSGISSNWLVTTAASRPGRGSVSCVHRLVVERNRGGCQAVEAAVRKTRDKSQSIDHITSCCRLIGRNTRLKWLDSRKYTFWLGTKECSFFSGCLWKLAFSAAVLKDWLGGGRGSGVFRQPCPRGQRSRWYL